MSLKKLRTLEALLVTIPQKTSKFKILTVSLSKDGSEYDQSSKLALLEQEPESILNYFDIYVLSREYK